MSEMNHESFSSLPVWESSKENVQPLKKGRSVKKLSESKLLENPIHNDSSKTLQLKEREFEAELLLVKDNNIALLEKYLEYFKWVRDSYPTQNDKSLKLLERCTVDLKEDKTLKNDIRFVKFWIEYADLVRSPNDIFAYMNSNKIGDKCSLFWIAWAFVTEKAENFKLTDQIFQKGIRHLAEPKDQLQKRYQQFQRRLARHYLNMTEVMNDQQLSNQIQQDNVSNPTSRQALSRISDENHLSRHPPSATNGNGTGNTLHASIKPKNNEITSNISFQIYSDDLANSAVDLLQPNKHWKNIGTESERRRENDAPVSMWSEGPLVSKSVIRSSESSRTVIPIFEDYQCKTTDDVSGKDNKQFNSGLSIRNKLDCYVASDSTDRIQKDPLSRHKLTETNHLPPTENKVSKLDKLKVKQESHEIGNDSSEAVKLSNTESRLPRRNDTSIVAKETALSTKDHLLSNEGALLNKKSKANATVTTGFQIFPDAPVQSSTASSKNTPKTTGFQIFPDAPVQSSTASSKNTPKISCDKSSSNSIRVLNENEVQIGNSHLDSKFSNITEVPCKKISHSQVSMNSNETLKLSKLQKVTDSNNNKHKTTSSFQIFSDSDISTSNYKSHSTSIKNDKLTITPVISNISSAVSDSSRRQLNMINQSEFKIYADNSDHIPTASSRVKHENKGSYTESPSMLQDEGDGATINTILAMKDIDSMFFSPGNF